MSAGSRDPLTTPSPAHAASPNCSCRLLSVFPSARHSAEAGNCSLWKLCCSLNSPGHPSPSGHAARMLLAQWSISPGAWRLLLLQPRAFLERPDADAAQPSRSLCCHSPDSFKTAKKNPPSKRWECDRMENECIPQPWLCGWFQSAPPG